MDELTIPHEHLPAIATLRDLPVEQLQATLSALSAAKLLLSSDELIAVLTPVLGDKAPQIANVIVTWAHVQRDEGLPDLMDAITRGLSTLPESRRWKPDERSRWSKVTPYLDQLMQLEVIHVLGKALSLKYEYANLLIRAHVVTDVRPVFTDDAHDIKAAVVGHVLRIEYFADSHRKAIELQADASDLERLLTECQRATTKAVTATQYLTKLQVPVAGGDKE